MSIKKHNTLISLIDAAFPYLVVLTYIFLCIEAVSYRGFLTKFIGFNSVVFYYFSLGVIILMALLFTFKRKYKISVFTFFFLKLQSLLLLPLAISYYILFFIEESNYPNFIYSQLHIQIDNFKYLLLFNIYLFLLFIFVSSLQKVTFKFFQISIAHKNYASLIVKILLVVFFINNMTNTIEIMVDNTAKILKQPFMSYDEKMKVTWGFFYDYMQFVKANTEPDSTILIPPAQNRWLTEGNSVLVRYFLFPRKVINVKEADSAETLYTFPDETFDYVLIVKGIWGDNSVESGWPKVSMQASEILYYTEDFQVQKSEAKIFDPTLDSNKYSWGLIKI